MKKLICICLSLWILGSLVSCSDVARDDVREDGVLNIVCTTFAGYDFARELTEGVLEDGDGKMSITLLGQAGRDMHSYEPTAADLVALTQADVFICISKASETWVEAALSAVDNPHLHCVEMMSVCDPMLSSEVACDNSDPDHDHTYDHEHSGDATYDEHVWVSLKNAALIVDSISKALIEAAPAQAEAIAANTAAYLAELDALDEAYTQMVAKAQRKTLLIADRYPFAYLMRDYGLDCHAAFPGCSSETEASFATQTYLIETVKEHELPYIFIIDGSDGKVAETVRQQTGADILVLSSCQVVTEDEMKAGVTYLSIARENFENLKKALND